MSNKLLITLNKMKKFIFSVFFLGFAIVSFANSAKTFLTCTTKDSNHIEVLILGHSGDIIKVGRAGKVYDINRHFLNIDSETDIMIDIADDDKNKTMYNTAAKVNNATALSKISEDIILSEFVLDSLSKAKTF